MNLSGRIPLALILTLFGSTAPAQTDFWRRSGPYDGTISCFAVNLNGDIFAGGSGVYRSTNGGKDWELIFAGGTQTLITSDSGFVFISGLRSTNNGNSWEGYGPPGSFNSLAFNDSGYTFVGTGGGGVYRLADTGSTWVYTGLSNGNIVALATDNSRHIFAGSASAGIFRSSDEGRNWTQSNTGLSDTHVTSLFVGDSSFIFVGTDQGAYRSTNSGDSWTRSGLPGRSVWGFVKNGATSLLAACDSGLFLSLNNGQNWVATGQVGWGLALPRSVGVDANGAIFLGTVDYGIFRSSNGGNTWSQVGGEGWPGTLAFAQDSTGNIFAGGERIFVSTDDAAHWTPISTLSFVTTIADFHSQIWVGTTNGIFLSTNSGKSWVSGSSGLPPNFYVSSLLVSDSNLYSGSVGYGVFRWTNNGTGWTAMNSGLTNHNIRTLAARDTFLFAGGDAGGIFRSTNAGDGWSPANIGLTSTQVMSLAVSKNGSIFAGTSDGGVFRSMDNGGNWVNVIPPTGGYQPTSSIVINGIGKVFVTRYQNGVLSSADNGSTWSQINGGLTDTSVRVLFISTDGYLFASTGSGVFRSTQLTTSVAVKADAPLTFTLWQNFPNPFNPTTTIRYELRSEADVTLRIFDAVGKTVETILGGNEQPGQHEISWSGARFSSGVYFYRLDINDLAETKKMILLR